MIAIHGKHFDLPAELRPCGCGRGTLTWDGRWAWRCTHRDVVGNRRCGVAITLGAYFDDVDLDLNLARGVALRDLQMTHYGLSQIARGLLEVSWLTRREAQSRMARMRDFEEERREFTQLQAMMRRPKERGS